MISSNYSLSSFTRTPSPSWGYYYTFNRPKYKHDLLWSCRRGRPYFISTLILIFWTPRSLYPNFTWIWAHFSYYSPRKRKALSIWVFRNNLRNTFYWNPRIYCMSPPYIYSGNRRWLTSLLYVCNYNYCNPNRN